MNEIFTQLDTIKLNFSPEGLASLNIILAFIIFGVALEIKVDHFKKLFLHPKSAISGIVSQLLLLPMATFFVVILLQNFITPTIALGMILVASCPGGNISNFISVLAKGNPALSVSLTAVSTLSAILVTPFNFKFWGTLYKNYLTQHEITGFLPPLDIDAFEMLKTVFIILGIPLLLGMCFNHKFPGLTAKISRTIKTLSILAFIGIVIFAFSNNFGYFMKYIKYIFVIVLIHNALALTTGYSFASILKLPQRDRRTITIETGIQNSGLGLVLLFNENIFAPGLPNGGMAFIAAWWGIWHIIAGLGIAWFWSAKKLSPTTVAEI